MLANILATKIPKMAEILAKRTQQKQLYLSTFAFSLQPPFRLFLPAKDNFACQRLSVPL